jgi:hypothetical protein
MGAQQSELNRAVTFKTIQQLDFQGNQKISKGLP